jgi:hypothetical protein
MRTRIIAVLAAILLTISLTVAVSETAAAKNRHRFPSVVPTWVVCMHQPNLRICRIQTTQWPVVQPIPYNPV